MKTRVKIIIAMVIITVASVRVGYCHMKQAPLIVERLNSVNQIKELFPRSSQAIRDATATYMQEVRTLLDALLAIPAEQRTFENTAQALDCIGSLSNLAIHDNVVSLIKEVHPDSAFRAQAQASAQEIQEFWIDVITDNKALYEAFKTYVEGAAGVEVLTPEQRYYLSETMKGFKRAGLDLPDDKRSQLSALKKELADLALQFETNIANDASHLAVTVQELAGLDADFIASLKQDDTGRYCVGVDYPTFMMVMQNCTIESTRKQLLEAFNNRAYPANEKLLRDIIAKRDTLALMLGFESYAALTLENQMAGSIDRVDEFLTDLFQKAQHKVDQELKLWATDLPESVVRTQDGKIKPWDLAFLQASYKKKYLSIDERALAEYFPMEKTIQGLFRIYEQFFGITFTQIPVTGLWHEDVKLVSISAADGSVLHGYVLLDLHPRPNKYSHAAHGSIVPATLYRGMRIPSVGLVMANFPKATADKPALCMRSDVSTFFHEFGHALHAALGRTQLAGQAGTCVKRDFVELPSQLLEEWLWDRTILGMVSSHYKTGAALPDTLIDTILKLKTFDTGNFVVRQVMLSAIALDYYRRGAQKDVYAILQSNSQRYRPQILFNQQDHFYASWGHLTGYAASYYGYLWSRVFAQDVFEQIKQSGLLNAEAGKKYVATIIGRGGSADPNELLRDFLGREPRSDAFFRDLGLV